MPYKCFNKKQQPNIFPVVYRSSKHSRFMVHRVSRALFFSRAKSSLWVWGDQRWIDCRIIKFVGDSPAAVAPVVATLGSVQLQVASSIFKFWQIFAAIWIPKASRWARGWTLAFAIVRCIWIEAVESVVTATIVRRWALLACASAGNSRRKCER